MPSVYLATGDLPTYGLSSATTTPDQILQASGVIDSYIDRVEGLVWSPDSQGLPCYMAALAPTFSATVPVALTAGQPATFAYPRVHGMSSIIGEVLIIDRATSNLVEAVSVTAFDQNAGTITVTAPINNHAIGATLETGLVLSEERAVAPKRSVTRVSAFPVARLLSGCGRYSYGRRGEQVAGLYSDYNLLSVLQTFAGAPMWIPFDIRSADCRADSGEVWVPAGTMLAIYTDVCLRYVSGYPASAIPNAVKQACANIIRNSASSQYAPPNFKIAQAGGSKFERFTDSLLDTDTKGLLAPFSRKLMF